MRKKNRYLIVFAFLILTLNAPLLIYAAESSPSATPTPTLAVKIKELKDRLASRVAELAILSKKVFKGEIKTLSDQKIIIKEKDQEINIAINDDTGFFEVGNDGKEKRIKLENLKKDQTVIAWGTYNSSTNTLTAKSIVAKSKPFILLGKIKSIDKKNYQLFVTMEDKDYLVDHEITTKDSLYDTTKGLVKAGFSKFLPGQLLYVYGFLTTTKDNKEMLSAQRIIIL